MVRSISQQRHRLVTAMMVVLITISAEIGSTQNRDDAIEAHAIYSVGPDGDQTIELEKAFATMQGLPFGLEVEGGYFLTEFGIINPLHAHAWDWQDQPVINTRIFGPDGMRQAGMRVGWLTPLPWFSQFHVGVQNANGETMPSFCGPAVTGGGHSHKGGEAEEEAVGMRPFVDCEVDGPAKLVYLMRWEMPGR